MTKNEMFRLTARMLAGPMLVIALAGNADAKTATPVKDSRTDVITALHEDIILARLNHVLLDASTKDSIKDGIIGFAGDRDMMIWVEDITAEDYFQQASDNPKDLGLYDFNLIPCLGLSNVAHKSATRMINDHLVRNKQKPRKWSKKDMYELLAPLRPIYTFAVSALMLINDHSLKRRTEESRAPAPDCNQNSYGDITIRDVIRHRPKDPNPTLTRRIKHLFRD